MKKSLHRDLDQKVIGGVCSGLGNYFDTDPLLFRAIFLLILFVGGSGVLLYCILWIILPSKAYDFPKNNTQESQTFFETESSPTDDSNSNITVGLILLCSGILLTVNNLVPDFDIYKFWPLILMVVGGGLIFGHQKVKVNSSSNSNPNEESK